MACKNVEPDSSSDSSDSDSDDSDSHDSSDSDSEESNDEDEIDGEQGFSLEDILKKSKIKNNKISDLLDSLSESLLNGKEG